MFYFNSVFKWISQIIVIFWPLTWMSVLRLSKTTAVLAGVSLGFICSVVCDHSVLESGERNANIPSGILNTYSLQRSWHKCMQVETGNLFKHCIMFSSFWMTLACQTQHKRIFIPRGNTGGATENRQRCGCPYDINHDNHYNNLNATSLKLRSLDVRARFNNFSPDL